MWPTLAAPGMEYTMRSDPSYKNQINLGTGWPDFATVVSHPYSSAVSLLEISCVSSAVIAPNVVSEYDP